MKNLIRLLTAFDGRIGRQQFWLGVLCIVVLTIALSLLAVSLGFGQTVTTKGHLVSSNGEQREFVEVMSSPAPLASLIISFLMTVPWLALVVKRRHDRDFVGYDVLGFGMLVLLIQLLQVLGTNGPVLLTLNVICAVWGICLLVLTGFLKGTVGPNKYGPDPLAALPTPSAA